jgi:hypothetical protein
MLHRSLRGLISTVIALHFAILTLTYATNWRRSAVQDRLHELVQPYSILGNWYTEMLPFECATTNMTSNETRISIQRADSEQWETLMSSWPSRQPHAVHLSFKSHRLMRLVHELIGSEDQEGLLRILKSIAVHDNSNVPDGRLLSRFRITQTSKIDTPSPDTLADQEIVLEATVVRLEDGSIGLIPKIDAHREVQARGAKP